MVLSAEMIHATCVVGLTSSLFFCKSLPGARMQGGEMSKLALNIKKSDNTLQDGEMVWKKSGSLSELEKWRYLSALSHLPSVRRQRNKLLFYLSHCISESLTLSS